MTNHVPQSVDQWAAATRQRQDDERRARARNDRDWPGHKFYHRDRPLTAEERQAMYAERRPK